MLVRLACTVVLVLVAVGVGSSVGVAGAAPGYESLMVPSAAMGRDIPVAFLGGGPHAVYLLDAFDAAPDVSNWVTQGNAMGTLGGRGVSVVAPAGHGVVGASQGGYAALALATFHPDRFRYAGSMSGFLTPERTGIDGAITAGLMQYGGVDTRNMWGLPQLGRWKWHSPNAHVQSLADNNTRLWVFSPTTLTTSDPAGMIGYPDQAQGTNRAFFAHYNDANGHNGHFEFPPTGDHGWSSWGPELAVMSSDLIANVK